MSHIDRYQVFIRVLYSVHAICTNVTFTRLIIFARPPNPPPHIREEDIQKMLSAQVHIGTRNSDSQMKDYIWRRRQVSSSLNYESCTAVHLRALFWGTKYLKVMCDTFCQCGEEPLKLVWVNFTLV